MKNNIITFIKGFTIGGTMLVPGVSGGTMAMILGIYEKLIKSVSHFFKEKLTNTVFLLIFSLGAFCGMALFSKSILTLLNNYHLPVMFFFIGAVVSGIAPIIKASQVKELSIPNCLYVLVGISSVLLISFLPHGSLNPASMHSISGVFILFVAGFIAAIALILPGISVSFVLLVMGIYEEIILAFTEFNIGYLSIIALGLIFGIIASTRILEKAMDKYTRQTYLIILGFVIGSVIPVFPGIPSGIYIPICILTFLSGFGIIHLLGKLDN